MTEEFSTLSTPKIGLYRNISIFFIVMAVILLVVVFLFFYNQATIIITSEKRDINLSFNLEIKTEPTADELREKDIIAGSLVNQELDVEGVFDVTVTKTVSSGLVGRVKLVNGLSKDQPLLKTTQLQAANGVIVRTNEYVVVPAGGSVMVDVYPKDPEEFIDIEPGDLTVIKLNPASQAKVYGVAETVLTAKPRQIKILSEADINQAKQQLLEQAEKKLRQEWQLPEQQKVTVQVVEAKTDKTIGEETEQFSLTLKVIGKYLTVNNDQLASLIARKVENLNLAGVQVNNINFNDLEYTITDEDLKGSVLAKVNYALEALIDKNNPILDPANLVGKEATEAETYLLNYDLIKEVDVIISPGWNKKIPKNEDRIKIIIRYE
ncbi:MAG TPA: hypothetical protein PKL09_01585 [bacterium]|nr:hypothetical protein [bacterium]HNS33635.1 hypothetical protein [bacterium]HNZ73221.1 hypothetical protein [bacterium]HOH67089.1 hypothetical protein [bacterium]